MTLFDENKEKMLEMLKKRKSEKKKKAAVKSTKFVPSEPQEEKPSDEPPRFRMGFYSSSVVLRNTVQITSSTIAIVKVFDNSLEMINWAKKEMHRIQYILLDIDQPTDWRESQEIFLSLTMMCPKMKFGVLTLDQESQVVEQMIKKGINSVVKKPLESKVIREILRTDIN